MTQEIEEVLNELEPRVVYDIEEEEEDPTWLTAAEERLATQNYGEQSSQEATDYFLAEIESLKEQLRKAQSWKPKAQYEIDEHRLCQGRRKIKLMEDQNKLLGLLIETLEENLDPNSFTRMKSFAVKNIIEMYDW